MGTAFKSLNPAGVSQVSPSQALTVNEGEGFDGLRKEGEERCPAEGLETEMSDE